MVSIELKGDTIQYPIKTKYGASVVGMKPAAPGTGIIAGGAMRAVLELAGVKDVLANRYGSTTVNVVRATLKALREMESPARVAKRLVRVKMADSKINKAKESLIGSKDYQRQSVRGLGLSKLGQVVTAKILQKIEE